MNLFQFKDLYSKKIEDNNQLILQRNKFSSWISLISQVTFVVVWLLVIVKDIFKFDIFNTTQYEVREYIIITFSVLFVLQTLWVSLSSLRIIFGKLIEIDKKRDQARIGTKFLGPISQIQNLEIRSSESIFREEGIHKLSFNFKNGSSKLIEKHHEYDGLEDLGQQLAQYLNIELIVE